MAYLSPKSSDCWRGIMPLIPHNRIPASHWFATRPLPPGAPWRERWGPGDSFWGWHGTAVGLLDV